MTSENESKIIMMNNKLIVNIENKLLNDKLVPVVLRQTDYTEEVAICKLEEHNYNLKSLLYEYMNISSDSTPQLTLHQERFKLYRNLLNEKRNKPNTKP
jgi:hypothetical protein